MTEYLNTTESHMHTEKCIFIASKCKKLLPHVNPAQFCHPPTAEPAVVVSYIPELTELCILVQTTGGLAYLEQSAPWCQLCYSQTSASICLMQANKEIILKCFLFLTPPETSQVRNLSSECVVKLRSVSGAQS